MLVKCAFITVKVMGEFSNVEHQQRDENRHNNYDHAIFLSIYCFIYYNIQS